MKQKMIITALVSMILFAMFSIGQAQDASQKIRIGVYDNRAIATAYFGSEYNPLLAQRFEMDKARARNDSATIKELEIWGPKFQRKIQFQGFCRVPVDDLLSHVKDKLAAVAKEAGVDLIGFAPNYAGANVETVDITDQLVALFDPSATILEEVKQVRATQPKALTDIVPVEYRKPVSEK